MPFSTKRKEEKTKKKPCLMYTVYNTTNDAEKSCFLPELLVEVIHGMLACKGKKEVNCRPPPLHDSNRGNQSH